MCKIHFAILLRFHDSLRGKDKIDAERSSRTAVPHTRSLSPENPHRHFNGDNAFVMDVISCHVFFCLGLQHKPLELGGSFYSLSASTEACLPNICWPN